MNKTSHGRWHRYRTVNGEVLKRCTGPLHPEEGEYLPLSKFWTRKRGERAGKPESRCIECERSRRGEYRGWVPVDRYRFIFYELEARVGRTEAARRLNVSPNFWMRLDRRTNKVMRRATVVRAVEVLAEARRNNEVRHRDSIHHGAARRGRVERSVFSKKLLDANVNGAGRPPLGIPDPRVLYKRQGDLSNEQQRSRRGGGSRA